MKKFIKNFLLFSLPIFILGISSEFLLRRIPNDYCFKKKFLDKNSDSIKVLFLGSSHAYYGINPADFSSKSFNASHVSQTIDYDFEILKKYEDHWSNLECIAIPISYFSLYERLANEIESWRVKNYTIYYGMATSPRLIDYSEVLSNKFYDNLRLLAAYYLRGHSDLSCSNLGWGTGYTSKKQRDLNETGISAAKRHSHQEDKYFQDNVNILKSIIEFAKSKEVKVFFYTPPAYRTYTQNLNSRQINHTINTMIDLDAEYDNAVYYNFLLDSSFTTVDFFDADHVDEIGAKKLTRKIDSLVNKNRRSASR